MIHLFILISIVTSIFIIFIGNFIFYLNSKENINRVFFIFCISIMWWIIWNCLSATTPDKSFAYFFIKMVSPWPFMIVFAFNLILLFTEQETLLRKWIIKILTYGLAGIFSCCEIFTDWMVYLKRTSQGYFVNITPTDSPISKIITIWVGGVIIFSLILLFRYYFSSKEYKRKMQTLFMIIGLGIAFIGGMVEIIIMNFGINFQGITNISFFVMILFIGYGIWRYRLFIPNPATVAENILSIMPDTLFITDNKGQILYVNSALINLLGYNEKELKGKHANILFVDNNLGKEIMGEMLNGKVYRNFETEFKTVFNKNIFVSLTNSILRDRDEGFVGTVCIGTDISERKRYELSLSKKAEELARSNSELEHFAYIASHDLQEPLRMIGSYIQLLARRYKGKLDNDADEFIGFAVDGVERLQAMINGLLEYSRVGTKGKEFTLVDTNNVLSIALENLKIRIEERKAKVTSDKLPIVLGDDIQLVRLFQNLISNALKYCNREIPEINIGVKKENNEWVFSFKDNGIGIEKQYFERIFKMFQRLHSRSEYSGTGIGLAVCKKIVERHGGRIWVESTFGEGSVFKFAIPINKEDI